MAHTLARIATGLLALVLACAALIPAWEYGMRYACIDYYQFRLVGRAVLGEGARDVYSPETRRALGESGFESARSTADALPDRKQSRELAAARQRRVLETYSTPFLYTVFGVLSSGDYERDQAWFQALSTAVYALALLVLARCLGWSLVVSAALLLALTPWFHPFVGDVSVGNVGRLQIGIFAAFVLFVGDGRSRSREIAAGVVLGAAVAFKPNLVFAALLVIAWRWLARERVSALAVACGAVAGGLIAIVAASLAFGSLAAWGQWSTEMPKLMAEGGAEPGNYALRAVWSDGAALAVIASPWTWIAITCAGAFAVGRAAPVEIREHVAAFGSREHAELDVACLGLGGSLAMLTPDLSWPHYAVLAAPLFVYVLRPLGGDRAYRRLRYAVRALAIVALLAVAFEPLRRLGWVRDEWAPLWCASGVACVHVLAICEMWLTSLARGRGVRGTVRTVSGEFVPGSSRDAAGCGDSTATRDEFT